GSDLVLVEGIGPVRCTLEAVSAGRGSASFALPQLPTQAGSAPDAAAVAAGLALSPADIDGTPARWSAGNPLSFVPIRSLAADVSGGRLNSAAIGGDAVVVTEGTLEA